ncbi:MAG: M48 family metalloprotease [Elusimicrobiaceae bacterium]|nr:M48 family metalloprotease [Elusimicrobiaceae bacterium]
MPIAYTYIDRNKRRSVWFIVLFAVASVVFTYVATLGFYVLLGALDYLRPTGFLTWGSTLSQAWLHTLQACRWLVPVCVLISAFWAHLALTEGDELVLSRIPGVRYLAKFEDESEASTLLENLSITVGMPTPRLYVLADSSMNAFTVGVRPERAAVVVSEGLLKNLDRTQLEGVLAHELAHIRNYDVRTMTVLVTCLAFFTFAGEYLFYGTEKENIYDENGLELRRMSRRTGFLAYIGLMMLIYGYLLAPLIRLGLSRTRERLADADPALITRHPRALARALWRISADSRIEALDSSVLLGAMCIATPAGRPNFFERISGLSSSHPPVEERIYALNDMDGMFEQFPTAR